MFIVSCYLFHSKLLIIQSGIFKECMFHLVLLLLNGLEQAITVFQVMAPRFKHFVFVFYHFIIFIQIYS